MNKPNLVQSGANALAQLVEFYSDALLTYETSYQQLQAVNAALADNIKELRATIATLKEQPK